MSTNSRIGVLRESGEVESIYCHWDGYPSHNGTLLLDHYTDINKINELIELGDLSSLGREIGEKHDFNTHNGTWDFNAPGGTTHTPSEAHEKGWCLFYNRDRGESDVAAKKHHGPIWPDYGQEYEYLFVPGDGWTFRDCYDDDHKPFQLLTPDACREET